eukprot:GHVP01001242.1.p1 GENE.GHVP01001242.1~~GHVP01001242.1.p1  ORF type:complete len:239 (+),score=35.49 GHVP01001242.1:158-874(+)
MPTIKDSRNEKEMVRCNVKFANLNVKGKFKLELAKGTCPYTIMDNELHKGEWIKWNANFHDNVHYVHYLSTYGCSAFMITENSKYESTELKIVSPYKYLDLLARAKKEELKDINDEERKKQVAFDWATGVLGKEGKDEFNYAHQCLRVALKNKLREMKQEVREIQQEPLTQDKSTQTTLSPKSSMTADAEDSTDSYPQPVSQHPPHSTASLKMEPHPPQPPERLPAPKDAATSTSFKN